MKELWNKLLCLLGHHNWYRFQDEHNRLYRFCTRHECWLGGVTQASVITGDGGSYWD